MLLRVTDLRQWAYCERIVFYQNVMPGVGKPTFKMQEGRAAQEMIERLEMRRTLREYALEGARRRFGLWIEDQTLGLSGKLDLLLEAESEAAVVEFKLTSGDPGDNHRVQLAGYAMLAEVSCGVHVSRAFIYRIPDDRIFPINITDELRDRVRTAVRRIREMTETECLPAPTSVRNRCQECEYANYCADIW